MKGACIYFIVFYYAISGLFITFVYVLGAVVGVMRMCFCSFLWEVFCGKMKF